MISITSGRSAENAQVIPRFGGVLPRYSAADSRSQPISPTMRSLLRLIFVPAACLGLLMTGTALPFDRSATDFCIAVGLAALIVWLVLKKFGRQIDANAKRASTSPKTEATGPRFHSPAGQQQQTERSLERDRVVR